MSTVPAAQAPSAQVPAGEAPPPTPTPTAAVERDVVRDMIRRGLPALPAVVVVAGLIWGVDGALSAALAVGLVLVNFLLSAAILSWAAKVSLTVLMAAAMLGFFFRLGLLAVAILLVKDQPWVELTPLAVTLLVTHLGLLVWETRRVAATLAFPGLWPRREA